MLRRNAEKYGINSYRVYKWIFVEYNFKSRLFGKLYKKNIQKHYYTILVQLVNSEILYKLFWHESTHINHNISTDIITFTRNICVWKNVSEWLSVNCQFSWSLYHNRCSHEEAPSAQHVTSFTASRAASSFKTTVVSVWGKFSSLTSIHPSHRLFFISGLKREKHLMKLSIFR